MIQCDNSLFETENEEELYKQVTLVLDQLEDIIPNYQELICVINLLDHMSDVLRKLLLMSKLISQIQCARFTNLMKQSILLYAKGEDLYLFRIFFTFYKGYCTHILSFPYGTRTFIIATIFEYLKYATTILNTENTPTELGSNTRNCIDGLLRYIYFNISLRLYRLEKEIYEVLIASALYTNGYVAGMVLQLCDCVHFSGLDRGNLFDVITRRLNRGALQPFHLRFVLDSLVHFSKCISLKDMCPHTFLHRFRKESGIVVESFLHLVNTPGVGKVVLDKIPETFPSLKSDYVCKTHYANRVWSRERHHYCDVAVRRVVYVLFLVRQRVGKRCFPREIVLMISSFINIDDFWG